MAGEGRALKKKGGGGGRFGGGGAFPRAWGGGGGTKNGPHLRGAARTNYPGCSTWLFSPLSVRAVLTESSAKSCCWSRRPSFSCFRSSRHVRQQPPCPRQFCSGLRYVRDWSPSQAIVSGCSRGNTGRTQERRQRGNG